ncbi:protoglobin domain-containing protein [Vulcanisaeta souniana]|uniref:Globin-sensor domain-containing protein n=1 Tax=Vulcanisaeta souniana JCM 11219 TaxID=1293586 RepID=A0A830EIB2_9CREN|nr:protoglobin domain-containing protein [Vulcanisaeta souniana]BDR92904.1 hypothetical protein Vsou_19970 [Vulcanisaeta souniana JCM 11219]GGI85491.1 hypothetical protein GCM10007112_23200 [Vulcanisaeta souniana JCM 11219]
MSRFTMGSEISKLLDNIVSTSMNQIPPPARFSDYDAQVITKFKPILTSITEDVVKNFYDILFSYEPTAAVFQPDERPLREKTLRDWWIRTLNGPFNEDYWLWQAYVGVIHYRRNVTPPMFMGMWAWIIDNVIRKTQTSPELVSALVKLGATQSSLMVGGYYDIVEYALNRVDIGSDLLRNLVISIIEELATSIKK